MSEAERKRRRSESQKRYMERMRQEGYVRVTIWVPDNEEAVEKLQNYNDRLAHEYIEGA